MYEFYNNISFKKCNYPERVIIYSLYVGRLINLSLRSKMLDFLKERLKNEEKGAYG